MKAATKIITGIIFVMLSPFFVQAQMPDPVTFIVSQAPGQVRAGQIFTLTLKAQIKSDWHLYAVHNNADAGPYPTQFSAANDTVKIAGAIKESDPVKEFDPNFKVRVGWHAKRATFTVPVAFLKGAKGEMEAGIKVRYQVCNDKVCLPPKSKTITRVITVSGIAKEPVEGFNASSNQAGAETLGAATEQGQIKKKNTESTANNGIFLYMWIAFTAGFGALISPCVYPMIPLTVSFFSKQSKKRGRSAVIPALGFGLAVIILFTAIGLLLSLFIGVSGANRFAANPWVNLFIALVLIIFAISLLGAFEIRLPYQLTNWLNKKSNESSGVIGILFIALTITAVSFSCTVPFVGGVLTATSRGEWFYPAIGMVCFSAAFASPFVLLAFFPGWVESLPQSGSWMNVIKVLLGFIELAAAFKFLSNADLVWSWGLISRPFTIAAWIAIFFVAGLYVLGVFVMKHEQKPEHIGTGRLMLALPFLLFSFYLIPGLMGASMGILDAWLPPKQATDVSIISSISQQRGSGVNSGQLFEWSNDYPAAVEEARENNTPVFIDFTGYTCTNCRAMEANVFPGASVQELLKKMKLVRLYTDDGTAGPHNQKFQFQLTGTVVLPTYVIIDPKSKKIIKQLEGYTEKKAFREFLNQGLASFHKQNSSI